MKHLRGIPILKICMLLFGLLMLQPEEAEATHFRYGNITWERVVGQPYQIRFKVSQAWRRSFYGAPNVGATVNTGSMTTGTGSQAVLLNVTSVNVAEDWFYGEYSFVYTYPSVTANYTASYSICCRVSNLSNNADLQAVINSTVTVGNSNDAPVSTVPPFINLPTNTTTATYQIPAADPNGDALTFSLAPNGSFGPSNTQPSGLSISSTGLVTFNTVGKAVGTLWNTAIYVTDSKGARIQLDLMIRITNPSTPPVFDYAVTPANSTSYVLQPGQPLSFNVKASDIDLNSTVNLSAVGVPPGATFSPTSGNPVTQTFSWTPTIANVGTYQVNFVAQDNVGIQTNSIVNIVVSQRPNFVSPSLVSGSILCYTPGQTITQTYTARDVDTADRVRLSLATAAQTGMSFSPSLPTNAANPTSTNFTWVTTAANWGIKTVVVRATDNYTETSDDTVFYIINNAPVLTTTQGNVTLTAGQPFSYTFAATDANIGQGDAISLSHTTRPSWLTIVNNNNNSWTISGTPSLSDSGTHVVSLAVEDLANHFRGTHCGNDAETFEIKVLPCNITTSAVATNVLCNGGATGAVNLTVNTATSPVNYVWSNSATTEDISGLAIGTYTVAITDANGCKAADTVTITEPAVLTASATGTNNVCSTNTNGTVDLTVAGGTTPYSYAWSNSATTEDISGLTHGAYNVVVTDNNGCTANAGYTVLVTDNIAPSITCPANISVNNDLNACGAVVVYTTPVGTDNCSGVTTTQTAGLASGSLFPIGTTTNTFKVTDANGNSNTCSFTVTVADNQNPTIANCSPNITKNVTAGQCGTNVSWTQAPLAPVVDQQLTAINIGTAGTDQWQSFTAGMNGLLTQIDLFHNGIQATAFTLTVYSGVGTSGAVLYTGNYNYGTFGSTWFGVPIPTGSQPTMVAGNTYTFRVQGSGLGFVSTFSSYGNYYSNSYGLNPCYSGGCWKLNFKTYVAVPGATTSANDNCGIDTFYSTHNSNDFFPVGVTPVTYTAKDIHGNTSTCSFNVTVVDNEAPVITCPANISVNNDASACGAVVSYSAPTSTDNCGVAGTVQTAGLASGSTFPVGTTTNTFVVTDVNGNTNTCSFTVTVTDNEAPSITCASNVSVNNDASVCGAVINYATPSTSDNCGIASTVQTAGLASGSTFPVGTTTNTFVVTDVNGNTNTCSFTVTVADNEAPSITCAANISVNNDATVCGAVVNYATPSTSDNCGVAGTVQTAGLASGATFPVGTTTNTFVVTDVNGNTNTCSFTVTVADNEAPSITCAGNVSVNNDATVCGAVVSYSAPTSTDNCGVAGTVQTAGLASGSTFPVGTTTNTFVVTDVNGNTNTCSFTVTVADNEAPSITCAANISVNNDADVCGAVVTFATPSTSDNCGIAGTVQTAGLASGATFPVGTTTNTFKVTDVNGNTNTCSFTVTVADNEAPVAACKPYTLNLAGGTGTVSPADVNNGSSDNCGIASMTVAPNTFSCNNAGNNTVVLTVTDIHGNVSTCTTSVTVQYQPTCSIATTAGNNTYTGGNPNNIYIGYGSQTATITANATGGSGFTYSWSPSTNLSCTNCQSPVFTATAAGNYTYTVTATNSNGCATTCTVSFCVTDIRVSGNGNKVYLCHVPPGNPNNPQTLSISANAVPSHLGQHSGDRLGKCNVSCGSSSKGGNEGEVIEEEDHQHDAVMEMKQLKVYPNPNNGTFVIELPEEVKGGQAAILDMAGRVIHNVTFNQPAKLEVALGDVASGVYMVQILNDGKVYRALVTVQ